MLAVNLAFSLLLLLLLLLLLPLLLLLQCKVVGMAHCAGDAEGT
jgi:hypothetical protein